MSNFLKFSSKNVIIIVGPKGIGKTTSLIKFSFQQYFRIFYFNLELFQINSDNRKKIELKMQMIKLFGGIKYDKEEDIKQKIEDYINKHSFKGGFEFIYNIIDLFKDFTKNVIGINFGFIIDQYPFKRNDAEKYDIEMIISLINSCNNIKLILCPTINNIFSKEQINSIFSKSLKTDNKIFDIYYFQEFISKDEFDKVILKGQQDKYADIVDEFGFSPKYFYEITYTNLSAYKEYLKGNLNDNIKEYYLSNGKNGDEIIDMNIEILNLLDLVKSEKIISSVDLKNRIKKLPLKYLKITKYKINDEIIKNISNKIDQYYKENKVKNKKEKNEGKILIKYLTLLWNNEKNNIYDKNIENNFF